VTAVRVVRLVVPAGDQGVDRRASGSRREPARGGECVGGKAGDASHGFQVYVPSFGWRNPGWAV